MGCPHSSLYWGGPPAASQAAVCFPGLPGPQPWGLLWRTGGSFHLQAPQEHHSTAWEPASWGGVGVLEPGPCPPCGLSSLGPWCPHAWAPGHQGQVALGRLMGVLEPRDLVSLQPFPSSGQELCWGAEKAEAARPPCWSSQRMWNVQTGPSPSAPALPLHAGSLRLPLLFPCPQDEANTHHGQLLVLQPGHGGALREPQLLGLPAL